MITAEEYLKNNGGETAVFEEVPFAFPKEYKGIKAGYLSVCGGKRSFIMVGFPENLKDGEKRPAAILLHGGGGVCYYEWIKRWTDFGYVAIAPDLDGHNSLSPENRKAENPYCGIHGYGFSGLYTSDPWIFYSALTVIKCADYLCALPCVDGDRIACSGISWGGVVALFVLPFEKRIKAATVFYSAAFVDRGMGRQDGMTEDEMKKYEKYYDACSRLDKINCKLLFVAGMNDGAFHESQRLNTLEGIKAEKTYSFTKYFYHSHIPSIVRKEAQIWTDAVFNGKPLPVVEFDGKTVKTDLDADMITVCFTTDEITADNVDWKETDGELNLSKDVKYAFASVYCKDGLIFSSDIIKLG